MRQSLTQEEVAERAGVSKDVVCRLEQGARDGLRIHNLYKLAGALDVRIRIGVEAEEEAVDEPDRALLLPLRRLLLPVVQISSPVDEAGLTPAALRRRVLGCTADYDHARYAKLAADLPELIHSVDAATSLHQNEDRVEAYRLLALAYTIAARLLIQLRDEILACEAVRRAMEAAENAGDPLLRASVVQDYQWAFRRQLMFDEAEVIGTSMAAEIGEPSITKATPAHLAVWGRLLEGSSRAAAENNRPEVAGELLSLAHTAAVRAGAARMDYGTYWANFSPVKIAITRAGNAAIGGDAELALHLGKGIRQPENLRLDAWTHHLALMAEAQVSVRDYAGAIETMKSIRRLASEWVKNHRLAHSVVLRLLDATDVRRAKSSGLAELARFMEVTP